MLHTRCLQSPDDHRERIMELEDVGTGEIVLLEIVLGRASEVIERPDNYDEWTPCTGAPDRHQLTFEVTETNGRPSVRALALIDEGFDTVDRIITGPTNTTDVTVSVFEIDGPNNILAQAAPYSIWQDGTTAFGVAEFDAADIDAIDSTVVVHELLHIMGMANIPGLAYATLVDREDGRLVFTGAHATRAWRDMGGQGFPPLYEPDGGNHWDEQALGSEIQTPFSDRQNIITSLTLGALIDIGYKVNRTAADQYNLRDALTAEICSNCTWSADV